MHSCVYCNYHISKLKEKKLSFIKILINLFRLGKVIMKIIGYNKKWFYTSYFMELKLTNAIEVNIIIRIKNISFIRILRYNFHV